MSHGVLDSIAVERAASSSGVDMAREALRGVEGAVYQARLDGGAAGRPG